MTEPEPQEGGALKAYALKLVDSIYHASVYTVVAYTLALFLLAIVAAAIYLKLVIVPEFHPQ